MVLTSIFCCDIIIKERLHVCLTNFFSFFLQKKGLRRIRKPCIYIADARKYDGRISKKN